MGTSLPVVVVAVETAALVLLVVQGALLLALLLVLGRFLVTGKRRFGTPNAWARKYSQTVQVDVPYEEAHALVHSGLAEVLGTMTSESRRRGEFGAWSGIDRGGAVRNRLEFRVEGAGVHSTQITVTSTGATGQWLNRMDPATIEERRRQVDRLADWLDRQ